MQTLFVGWEADNAEFSATMRTDKDYRFARLTICGHFLSEPKADEMLYHELIHCVSQPMVDFMREVIEITVPDNESLLRQYLEKELARHNEMLAQDLAYAVEQRCGEVRK